MGYTDRKDRPFTIKSFKNLYRNCKRAVRKDIIENIVWGRVEELLKQDNEGDPTIGGVNVGIVT